MELSKATGQWSDKYHEEDFDDKALNHFHTEKNFSVPICCYPPRPSEILSDFESESESKKKGLGKRPRPKTKTTKTKTKRPRPTLTTFKPKLMTVQTEIATASVTVKASISVSIRDTTGSSSTTSSSSSDVTTLSTLKESSEEASGQLESTSEIQQDVQSFTVVPPGFGIRKVGRTAAYTPKMATPALQLNSGHKIPQLGLGTCLSKPGEVGEAVKIALEVGYRSIDCAHVYGNQEEIGHVFKEAFGSGKVKREDVFITSKIWNTFHSYQKATEAIDIILKDLQIAYLDLCLIHWPMGYVENKDLFPKDDQGKIIYADTDYLETWRAMEDAVKAGKVRSIGLSNFNVKQIERIIQHGTIKPAALKVESHPYFPQKTVLDWCKKQGLVLMVYSPLANNSHMASKESQPNLLEEKLMVGLTEKHHKTPAQIVLRWAIQRGTVPIPKSTKRVHLEENLNVFDFDLSEEDMASIDTLDRNWRILAMDRDLSHPHYPFRENA